MAPAKRTRRKKPGRGGARPGAGRKRLDGIGATVVPVTLTAPHIQKVRRWRGGQGEKNFSGAVRDMIDRADTVGPT